MMKNKEPLQLMLGDCANPFSEGVETSSREDGQDPCLQVKSPALLMQGTNITLSRGTHPILNGLSFIIKRGVVTAFIGASGGGKTSLLKCMATLHHGYGGQLTYEGKDLRTLSPAERSSTVGFVAQQFHLFPHLTVVENCCYALTTVTKMPHHEAYNLSCQKLSLLGMDAHLQKYPSQLSGGQQQRAAIARALVLQPQLLIFDEPTSALDPESKKTVREIFAALLQQGITIAFSSHDIGFTQKVAAVVYFIEQGTCSEMWECDSEPINSKEKICSFITTS